MVQPKDGAALRLSILASLLILCVPGVLSLQSKGCADPRPATKSAFTMPIPFSLVDSTGKMQSLSAQHGHPVALFFFCGCTWCAALAKQWGQLQQQGALQEGGDKVAPITMVVFSGDADSVKSFASETGLDLKQTILLPDPTMKVTLEYKSDTCPRVFVINRTGTVAYTNNHKDDMPRQASAQVIAYLALSALRASSKT